MKKFIRNSYAHRLFRFVIDFLSWEKRQFSAPCPHHIKQACILRNGISNATWIETGTFLGETTYILSKTGEKVFSIEPEPTLFLNASIYFKEFQNVKILNGTSESLLPDLLSKLNGNVNFWLDGHYSSGNTFRGKDVSPIVYELNYISTNLNHFNKVCILIDDVRLFNPHIVEHSGYPSINYLVDWARENHLDWHIEHDIFVAKN